MRQACKAQGCQCYSNNVKVYLFPLSIKVLFAITSTLVSHETFWYFSSFQIPARLWHHCPPPPLLPVSGLFPVRSCFSPLFHNTVSPIPLTVPLSTLDIHDLLCSGELSLWCTIGNFLQRKLCRQQLVALYMDPSALSA